MLSNGEKISDLCGQLENVKVEQDELDQELDRVNAQQVELEGIFFEIAFRIYMYIQQFWHHLKKQ